MKQIVHSILIMLIVKATSLQAQTADPHLLPKAQNFMQSSGTALAFEENKGQVQGKDSDKVRFTVKAPGIDIFILNNGIAYQYKKVHYPEGYFEQLKEHQEPEQLERLTAAISTETFRMDALLAGANPQAEIVTEGRSTAVTHYYNHNALKVSQYQKVIFKNIYPLIDWQLLFKNGQLEYEFVVHPGGDPEQIRFRYEHNEGLALQKDGSLQLQSKMGNITDQAPVSFQDGRSISTAFVLEGKEMRFKLSAYDVTQKLIIDPALVWATYFGGEQPDEGRTCTTDADGNIYVGGVTYSTTGINEGGYQTVLGGGGDAFLVKFSSNGTRLWATYYGGINYEIGNSCAADASGNIYLAGHSGSSGLAANGHQNVWAGSYDGFLVKFNSNGIRIWATYYGGSGMENGNSCATDAAGNVYFAGRAGSATNIAASGHQNSLGGGANDAFIVKFDSNGVRQWGTYYGGTGTDAFHGCAVDPAGNVYMAGETNSTSNIAHNAHQSSLAGFADAFLVKLNSSGVLQWGTYYGGGATDYGYDCAADASGNVYLAGQTLSSGGIAATGHQNSIAGNSEAFLAKFNSNGVRQWGTYYGGASSDLANSCAVDASGNVYIAGTTSSSSGIAVGGVQNIFGGNNDAFCVKFNNAGILQWGSYFGGADIDAAFGCATDVTGHIYFTGRSNSLSGIASGGYQNTSNGQGDAFLAKFSIDGNPLPLTLTGFSATATGSRTHLSWETAKEVNVQTISVERSNEKTDQWETIAIQNAKGALNNYYEDWDPQPLNGTNLYRLKMTDIDGTFTHSAVRKAYFDRASDHKIRIFPNPNNGIFTIEFGQNPNAAVNVRITDILGRSVYNGHFEGTKRAISGLKLNAGAYLVTVQHGEHIYTEKMVVE